MVRLALALIISKFIIVAALISLTVVLTSKVSVLAPPSKVPVGLTDISTLSFPIPASRETTLAVSVISSAPSPVLTRSSPPAVIMVSTPVPPKIVSKLPEVERSTLFVASAN